MGSPSWKKGCVPPLPSNKKRTASIYRHQSFISAFGLPAISSRLPSSSYPGAAAHPCFSRLEEGGGHGGSSWFFYRAGLSWNHCPEESCTTGHAVATVIANQPTLGRSIRRNRCTALPKQEVGTGEDRGRTKQIRARS